MGAAPYVPGPPSRHPRPRTGPLLALVEQPAVGTATYSWHQDDGRVSSVDVGYSVALGPAAGRRLDCSLRTHLLPLPGSITDLSEAHARAFAQADLSGDARWAQITVDVDGVRTAAQHAILDGWELVALRVHGRPVSVVTSVFDAELFTPDYVTIRPWPDAA